MNLWSWIYFLAMLFYLSLAGFVVHKNTRSLLNWLCASFILCFALWSFGPIFIYSSNAPKEIARIFYTINSPGWIFFGGFLIWFALLFTRNKRVLKNPLFYAFIFLTPIYLFYLQLSGDLTQDYIRTDFGWTYVWAPTWGPVLYYFYYGLCMLVTLGVLYDYMKKAQSLIERRQAKVIFISVFLPVFIGTVSNFIAHRIHYYKLIPVENLVTLGLAGGIVFAIVKLRFLTITPVMAASNIISTMSDALFLLDEKGEVVFANKAAEDLSSCSQAELKGKPFYGFFESNQNFQCALGDLSKTRHMSIWDLALANKEGMKIPVSLTSSTLRDASGEVVGNVCILRDMTERVRSEKDLREHEALLKATLESTAEGFLVVNHEGKITHANQRFMKLWRIPQELLETKDDEKLLAFVQQQLENPEAFLEKVRELYGSSREDFETIHFKDGRIYERYSCPLMKEGEIAGRVWSFRDITFQVKAEEDLKKSAEKFQLAQKMDAIGKFAGGVAHDFNNQLMVIMGYCGFLMEQIDSKDPRRHEIREIQIAAERSSQLTRQLLAFGRRQMVALKVFEMNVLLQDMENSLRTLLGEAVQLTLELEPDLWKVKADPSLMEQVIINLAVNARDAMPNGGILTLRTENVVISGSGVEGGLRAGPYVMIKVADTGIGMSEEVKKHIMEPFFSTKPKGRGTGLGLSTSYGIVKQAQGDIEFESELGKGTTFKIYLPSSEEPVERLIAQKRSLEIPRGTESVLVVEDEAAVLRVASAVLKRQGYRVWEALGPSQALEIAAGIGGEESLDLLITDVVMPKMNGRELGRILQTKRPKMKVLYISGYTDDVIDRHGILEPGIFFLQKPFSPDALAFKVREVLNSRVNSGS
ncbi:MAG: PAS domain S-box protein [Candidatus Omnitrophica bacterium]|nr:PAS domain S-box protein [Candidatus Omnitrophota bacterium]